MKKRLMTIILVAIISSWAMADRMLEPAEIDQILQSLCQNPRTTWIDAGTIEAEHEEYRAAKITDPNELDRLAGQAKIAYQNNLAKSEKDVTLQKMTYDAQDFNNRYELGNESTMLTKESVIWDGHRYAWDIQVIRRTDTVKPPINANFAYEYFNLEWNGRRSMFWDGQTLTSYNHPVNAAQVSDAPNTQHVSGPLTAGIIPWGNGLYSQQSLQNANLTGVETDSHLVQLSFTYGDNNITVLLDPNRAYTPLAFRLITPNGTTYYRTYDSFQYFANRWIPRYVSVEQYSAIGRLLERDIWRITRLDIGWATADFSPRFEVDAQIDKSIAGKRLIYRVLPGVDMETLETRRQEIMAGNPDIYNCATVALQYALGQFGTQLSDAEVAPMIGMDHKTSMLTLKIYAEACGYNAQVVKLDLDTLGKLPSGCQAILYLTQGHFVNFVGMDSFNVRLIDLDNNKFTRLVKVWNFTKEWDGTALLLGREKGVSTDLQFIPICDLDMITGGQEYPCDVLLQSESIYACAPALNGQCGNSFRHYYERWGCNPDSLECVDNIFIRMTAQLCVFDLDLLKCTYDEETRYYYIFACE